MSDTTISSNHFSVDVQASDALDFLRHNYPMSYGIVRAEFPEVDNLKFGYMSSHFDTEAMGVDDEWGSWLIDAIEATGLVYWDEGEPWGHTGPK